jgi:hypothetical protein
MQEFVTGKRVNKWDLERFRACETLFNEGNTCFNKFYTLVIKVFKVDIV